MWAMMMTAAHFFLVAQDVHIVLGILFGLGVDNALGIVGALTHRHQMIRVAEEANLHPVDGPNMVGRKNQLPLLPVSGVVVHIRTDFGRME